MSIVSVAALGVYIAAVAVLALYAAHSLWLLVVFLRHRRRAQVEALEERATALPDSLPVVLVQLPVFNERDVVERLVMAAGRLRWPRDRLRIQLLDDSTDDSVDLGARAITRLRDGGLDAMTLHRIDRHGFKAGALGAGLEADARHSAGPAEFVAIFDADFVPEPDFLERAIKPFFTDARLGLVQGRWEHLNRDTNRLTRAQAIGIDAHFALEQGARAWSGLPMNFNGTCGLWRVAAIHESGGWQHDTLTEDMDLSYRCQLAGWRCTYRLELAVPGEIPATVSAWRAQQFRWAKGSIQTARKLLPRIWRSAWSLRQKIAATFHTTHYLVHPLIVVSLLVAPLAMPAMQRLAAPAIALGAALFAIGVGSPLVLYVCAQFVLRQRRAWRRLADLPIIAAIGTGVAISNTRAVWQALRGRTSDFVRTPKQGNQTASSYRPPAENGWLELLSGAWATAGALLGATGTHPWAGLVLMLYASGFTWVGWMLRREHRRIDRGVPRALAWLIPLGVATVAGYGLLGAATGTWRERPLLFAGVGCALAAVYLGSCAVVRRLPLGRGGLAWVAVVAVLARLLALGIAPSDDVNRYVVEGTQVRAGENPYEVPPARSSVSDELPTKLRAGVNHPEWTAIYPPLTLLLEAAITTVSVDPFAFKLVMLFAELAGLLLVYGLLVRSGHATSWILLAAWNPLGPLFGVGEGHLDFFMAAFLAGTLWLWARGRVGGGVVAAVMAAMIKPFALLSLPAKLRPTDSRHWALAGIVILLAYAPFLGAGLALFRSVGRFGTELHFNGTLEPLLRWMVSNTVSPESVQLVTATLLAVLWCVASWRILRRARRLETPVAATVAQLLGVLLVCLPTLHPWYLAPLALLLPLTRSWALVVWTAFAPVYWLHGLGISPDVPWAELGWVTALAHAPAALVLLFEVLAPHARATVTAHEIDQTSHGHAAGQTETIA